MEYTQDKPRTVEAEFTKHRRKRTLIRRSGNVCMYQVDNAGIEVVVLRVSKPCVFPNGTEVPWRETLPSDEDFGRYGWYFGDGEEESARRKYNELTATH